MTPARARARLRRMSSPSSLPSGWPALVCDAVLQVIAMAHLTLTRTRSWAANSPLERVRLRVRVNELEQEVALLRQEVRIKDARLERLPGPKRPRYPPAERLAILAHRAARRWSMARTARAFLVTEQTIRSWMRRLGEHGPDALVQVPVPVTKFPDFVAVVVQQLRVSCPSFGKVRIAQLLARAGLLLSASTAKRMMERPTKKAPEPEPAEGGRLVPPAAAAKGAARVVTARHAHHVWHVDLTIVPTALGFWVPWLPKVLAQRWPFGVWVAVVMDHFSRSIVGRGIFDKQPTAGEVCGVLERSVRDAAAAPRHIISDQGPQFQKTYRAWCTARGAKPRFGAIGQHGSIAVIERFMRSLKDESMRRVVLPMSVRGIERELDAYLLWYDEYRPHQSLGGRTPGEVLRGEGKEHGERIRAHHAPHERAPLRLVVSHVEGRRHLPIVSLKRAA